MAPRSQTCASAPAFEDKLLQMAAASVRSTIYEQDFLEPSR